MHKTITLIHLHSTFKLMMQYFTFNYYVDVYYGISMFFFLQNLCVNEMNALRICCVNFNREFNVNPNNNHN